MGKSNGRIEAPITHEGTDGAGVSVAGAASRNLVGLRARLLAASGAAQCVRPGQSGWLRASRLWLGGWTSHLGGRERHLQAAGQGTSAGQGGRPLEACAREKKRGRERRGGEREGAAAAKGRRRQGRRLFVGPSGPARLV
jgi:hypothetical protein